LGRAEKGRKLLADGKELDYFMEKENIEERVREGVSALMGQGFN
jgi:hypothetical protein